MSRFLVDVTLTLDVECDAPGDIDTAVAEVLAEIEAWRVQTWETGDFTVVEP